MHSDNIICLTTGCIRDARQAPNGKTDTEKCINVADNFILETKTSQSICMAHIILQRETETGLFHICDPGPQS